MAERLQARQERAALRGERALDRSTPWQPEPDTSATPSTEVPRGAPLFRSVVKKPELKILCCDQGGAFPPVQTLSHAHKRSEEEEVSARAEDEKNLSFLKQISGWEKTARSELRTKSHQSVELRGEKTIPDWRISNLSNVLNAQAGQDSWELYKARCLPRDQVAVLKIPYSRLEEFGAHALLQAETFLRALSIKSMGLRKCQMTTSQKNRDLRTQLSEQRCKERSWNDERATFEAKIKELEESRVSEVTKALA
ncbi:UNVERIFIED_CONTAM: hypothetical protein Sindi_2028800 [Sesamum indicum]